MKKLLLVSLTMMLVVGLVVGMAFPGLAKTDNKPASSAPWSAGRQVLRGIVDGIDEDEEYFTIDEGEVTIWVNDATRYFQVNAPQRIMAELRTRERLQEAESNQEQIQQETRQRLQQNDGFLGSLWSKLKGGKGKKTEDALTVTQDNERAKKLQGNLSWLLPFGDVVTFAALDPGDQVVVFAVPRDDEGPLAKLVFIMEPSEYGRVTGEITNIDEGNKLITIEPNADTEDTPEEFHYDDDTVFNLRLRGTFTLEEGMTVSIIYIEDGEDYFLAKTVTTWSAATTE